MSLLCIDLGSAISEGTAADAGIGKDSTGGDHREIKLKLESASYGIAIFVAAYTRFVF